MTPYTEKRPTQAYIDLDALAFNLHSCRKFLGSDIRVMAVVKADAYGHGAVECASRLEHEGVDWFGVAIPEEGVQLRKAGIKTPVLCLGSFWPGQEQLLVEHNLTPVIFDLDTASLLERHAMERGVSIDVHVKIDTGMGRVGWRFENALEFAKNLSRFKHLNVNGLLTHFASAEDPKQSDFTHLQITRFNETCEVFRNVGCTPTWFDLANSPGAIAHPESRGNMVRLGGALYGLIDDILTPETRKPELRPVLSLSSRITHIKNIPAGETLGYGRTFTTQQESLIALLPIGYADGYPRGLSNQSKAYVNGSLVPVVGRISMDWTLLDVSSVPETRIGNEVFLIGGGPDHAIKAADLARELGTIGYEITCGISPRVPRIPLIRQGS